MHVIAWWSHIRYVASWNDTDKRNTVRVILPGMPIGGTISKTTRKWCQRRLRHGLQHHRCPVNAQTSPIKEAAQARSSRALAQPLSQVHTGHPEWFYTGSPTSSGPDRDPIWKLKFSHGLTPSPKKEKATQNKLSKV